MKTDSSVTIPFHDSRVVYILRSCNDFFHRVHTSFQSITSAPSQPHFIPNQGFTPTSSPSHPISPKTHNLITSCSPHPHKKQPSTPPHALSSSPTYRIQRVHPVFPSITIRPLPLPASPPLPGLRTSQHNRRVHRAIAHHRCSHSQVLHAGVRQRGWATYGLARGYGVLMPRMETYVLVCEEGVTGWVGSLREVCAWDGSGVLARNYRKCYGHCC